VTSLRLLAFLSLSSLVAACSSKGDDTPATGGSGGNVSSGGDSNSGGKQSTDEACPEGDGEKTPRAPEALGTITGQIVDEQGEPTSSGLVQICGKDICINARVGESGRLSEAVSKTLDSPACKWGDGFTWAKLALPLAAGDSDLGQLMTARLPDYSDSVPLVPGKRASSGGVTLTLDRSARVDVNALDYESEAEQGFRAVAIPKPALTSMQEDFVTGYALSPLETRICPNPALSLDNVDGLDAGTELELFMLGLDVNEAFAPYGKWIKIGEGNVTADGQTLEFPSGLPLLTAIAVKVKP